MSEEKEEKVVIMMVSKDDYRAFKGLFFQRGVKSHQAITMNEWYHFIAYLQGREKFVPSDLSDKEIRQRIKELQERNKD